MVNGHPVWLKDGHDSFISVFGHPDLYIWLDVNHSRANHPWRWVIGIDYTDTTTIVLQCLLNDTNTEYIDDPTLCMDNWWVGDTFLPNVSSTSGICQLEASFVCIETSSSHFDNYFSGRYRLYHPGQPYWISENAQNSSILFVDTLEDNFDGFGVREWWVFFVGVAGTVATTGRPEAWCPYLPVGVPQSLLWSPQDCLSWYVWRPDLGRFQGNVPFDVDECTHSSIIVNDTITYPQYLCMNDPSNTMTFYEGMIFLFFL